ncbi:MAG: D-lyxose/D-mannose family sugar isomerase [Promethearchaeota archaeon]
MKRSEVNKVIKEAIIFLQDRKFYLPSFAFWTINDWKSKGTEIKEIVNNQLGWDITDYGRGDFNKNGLIHFTIRNGNLKDLSKGGKPYCEKIMIIKEKQTIPLHHHYKKMEDIINRGGGILVIRLFNCTKNDELEQNQVKVMMDGERNYVDAGGIIELHPGDSVTLTPKHYHEFWAKKGGGKVLIGEVSSINDDYIDNKFYEHITRFSDIEEDEKPLYLLHIDYEKYIRF